MQYEIGRKNFFTYHIVFYNLFNLLHNITYKALFRNITYKAILRNITYTNVIA